MKFELKTENDNYSRSFSKIYKVFFILALLIFFCDVALKLGIISRYYQIEYKCRLLAIKKSDPNFKNLSKLTNLKSKQRILEFCRQVVR